MVALVLLQAHAIYIVSQIVNFKVLGCSIRSCSFGLSDVQVSTSLKV